MELLTMKKKKNTAHHLIREGIYFLNIAYIFTTSNAMRHKGPSRILASLLYLVALLQTPARHFFSISFLCS